jgi:hypothetical protein
MSMSLTTLVYLLVWELPMLFTYWIRCCYFLSQVCIFTATAVDAVDASDALDALRVCAIDCCFRSPAQDILCFYIQRLSQYSCFCRCIVHIGVVVVSQH